jgi:hypothetical protein
MEQRAMLRFFAPKGLKAKPIHIKLESMYGSEALARPTVTKWRRRFHQGRTDLFDHHRSGRHLLNVPAVAIGSMFKERLFDSCKVLCRQFRIGTRRACGLLRQA